MPVQEEMEWNRVFEGVAINFPNEFQTDRNLFLSHQ